MKEKLVKIFIQQDSLNAEVGEQYKFYQKDGITVQVPIGTLVEVPEWVATRAMEIGEIDKIFD